MTRIAPGKPDDRRVRRTRLAIVSAFSRLILERGYATLTPGDVAAAADVGRSTFYEHFGGMNGLLAEALGRVLTPLAQGCLEPDQPGAARLALAHIWDNRQGARMLLENSRTQTIVLRGLADQFATILRRRPSELKARPVLDIDLVALQLAGGQLALLGSWLAGSSGCSVEEIATALQVSGRALCSALLP